MMLEVLCTPYFSEAQSAELDALADKLGLSRAEVVRKAVRFFSAKCVPTHSAKMARRAFSSTVCTHTSRERLRKAAR